MVVAAELQRDYAHEQDRVICTVSGAQASKPGTLPATISATEIVFAGRIGNYSTLPVRTATGMLQPFVLQVDLMMGVLIEIGCPGTYAGLSK
jgi:hypothetical protein